MEIKKLITDEIGKLQKEITSYKCRTPECAITQGNQINLLENLKERILIKLIKNKR